MFGPLKNAQSYGPIGNFSAQARVGIVTENCKSFHMATGSAITSFLQARRLGGEPEVGYVGLWESGPGRDASSKFLEGILYATLLASSQWKSWEGTIGATKDKGSISPAFTETTFDWFCRTPLISKYRSRMVIRLRS
jgi:hypothetical protein